MSDGLERQCAWSLSMMSCNTAHTRCHHLLCLGHQVWLLLHHVHGLLHHRRGVASRCSACASRANLLFFLTVHLLCSRIWVRVDPPHSQPPKHANHSFPQPNLVLSNRTSMTTPPTWVVLLAALSALAACTGEGERSSSGATSNRCFARANFSPMTWLGVMCTHTICNGS